MCIIVAKPKNVEFPSEETLETCWWSNPDGAGIMWVKDGHVEIRKGFMEWRDFLKKFRAVRAEVGTEGACVMHFRIATHGEVSQECCHPFPLSGDLAALRKVSCKPKVGIAHNGIIPNRDTDKRTSDTMDYIANFVYPLSKCCPDWLSDKWAGKLIDDTLNSKMCVLESDGDITTFGEFIMDGGVLYSNSGFRGYRWGGYTYHGGYKSDFAPYGDESFKGICEWCEDCEDCTYFGHMCTSREEAAATAFYGYDDADVRSLLGSEYDRLMGDNPFIADDDEDDDGSIVPLQKAYHYGR